MPYKNPKDRKKQVNAAVGTTDHKARMERQRARRKIDKEKGPKHRKGKDVSHNKSLANGGTNKDGYKIEDRSKNRARNYKKKG